MPKEVNPHLPDWETLYRLVPSHFPPINLFENVVDADDLELVFAIESLTNDRLKDAAGELAALPKADRISGAGITPVMAAFTHISQLSRFTNGQNYGVYYGSKALITAIKETAHHREVFLRMTNEDDTELTMRCYANKVAMEMHDIRGEDYAHLHKEDYLAPQAFANELRANGSNGLLYNSVIHTGGECIAAFKPKAVTIPVQAGHYKYQWRAKEGKITSVLEVSKVDI
jgi:hypothetical protein